MIALLTNTIHSRGGRDGTQDDTENQKKLPPQQKTSPQKCG